MHILCSKLVCLFKSMKGTYNNEKILAYFEIFLFYVHQKIVMFCSIRPRAYSIKHYGFVIYGKLTDFVVS
jgi:hypothetical protein